MSFAIIISEKGGAERRELFDKNEVVVGRLQGNDLMLQKSNVSKRHVKLMLQQGRFIVADLESTNGTYVNGRKILKPTIVREGDKIYVGDFVLRFEAGPGMALAPESSPSAPGPREATAAELGSLPPPGAPGGQREGISHYPLENDPDEAQPKISIPAAPRLPSGLARPGGTQAMAALPTPQGPSTDASNPQIHALAHAVVAGATAALGGSGVASPAPPTQSQSTQPTQPQPPPPPPPRAASISSPSLGGGHTLKPAPLGRDASANAAHRLALAALVDAVAERVDLAPLKGGALPVEASLARRIEQALREVLPQLRQDGEMPESASNDLLIRDAQRELLAFGPLGPLLEDEDVTAVHLTRHDLLTVQRGSTLGTPEPAFSSEEALRRAIARLCHHAGQPLGASESLVERRLPQGQLVAVLPPTAPSTALTLRRRRRADASSEDPVRSGLISRVAWNFLLQCLGARLSLLVVAPPGAAGFLASLVASLPTDERTAVLLPPELTIPAAPHHLTLALDADRPEALVRAAGKMIFDRVVLGSLADGAGHALLEITSARAVATLAMTHGSSTRQATARLVAELCASRPGLPPDVAREWLASSFDLVVEINRARDGRLRVLRVAEVTGVEGSAVQTRDLFLAVADRNGDSNLAPTGTLPRFLDDLRARGFPVDPSIFERASSR